MVAVNTSCQVTVAAALCAQRIIHIPDNLLEKHPVFCPRFIAPTPIFLFVYKGTVLDQTF